MNDQVERDRALTADLSALLVRALNSKEGPVPAEVRQLVDRRALHAYLQPKLLLSSDQGIGFDQGQSHHRVVGVFRRLLRNDRHGDVRQPVNQ